MCVQRHDQRRLTRFIDVASPVQCDSFVREVIATLGRIDHVFNCPSIEPLCYPTNTFTDECWDQLDTYRAGVLNITSACSPHLQSGASFVNALGGMVIHPKFADNCNSIISFSRNTAIQLQDRSIRTNVMTPCFTDAALPVPRIAELQARADLVYSLMAGERALLNGEVVATTGVVPWNT
jgi:NAD(P)-dependent dehydrogenase (short-subunit alcohol dehydrogenase family)